MDEEEKTDTDYLLSSPLLIEEEKDDSEGRVIFSKDRHLKLDTIYKTEFTPYSWRIQRVLFHKITYQKRL